MRFLLGLIFGVLVAVGAAYVHDSAIRAPDQPAIVNWTALDSTLRLVREDVASGWERLSKAARS
ncbi:MAG TPA: hypothetical protein PKA55_12790 [Rhodoblastus sp.]|nr:hypothetical protein [Rhodoblastus sp.]